MVIECPSCHTKFFIDSSQLEEVESPRFHCSRCDHFFELNAESRSTAPEPQPPEAPQENPPEESFEAAAQPPAPETDEALTDEAEQLDWLPKSKSGRHKETIRVDRTQLTYKVVDGKKVPLITADWPDAPEHEQREVDMRSILDTPDSAISEDDLLAAETEAGFVLVKRKDDHAGNETRSRLAADLAGDDSWDKPDNFSPAVTARPEPERRSMVWDHEKKFPDTSDHQIERGQALRSKGQRSASLVTREDGHDLAEPFSAIDRYRGANFLSLLILCSMPLAVFLVLGLWGRNVSASPTMIKNWLGLRNEQAPHLAPAGLGIIDLSAGIDSLVDGKKVVFLQGKVINATLGSFTNIVLEAKLYDEENQELASLRAPAENGLSGAKILAFPLDQLNELQQKPADKPQQLKPNETVPFQLVFTEAATHASWFSARIYSVSTSGS